MYDMKRKTIPREASWWKKLLKYELSFGKGWSRKMMYFWIRGSFISGFWVLFIVQDSTNIAVSLLAFAISFALFCLLSLNRALLTHYLILSVIGLSHGWVMMESLLPILYLQMLAIDASYRLSTKNLYYYLLFNGSMSILYAYSLGDFFIEIIISTVLCIILILSLNHHVVMRHEQRELYDQLLGEYRKSKRLNLSAQRNARLEERTKIARDMHDSVGHRLTALIMKLEMLSITHQDADYQDLKEMAMKSLEETRQAVSALQTEEHEGISTVVHLIRKLEAESHMLVQFTVKQGVLSIPLTNQKSVVLYRVIQEALTNAMRHAQSREVDVTLGKAATGAVSFEISNAVFDSEPFTEGFGLTNMKKRVDEVKGSMEIYRTEKKFIVSGMIPV
ncbi:sensor histidine kinase [Virgibacillus salarius]